MTLSAAEIHRILADRVGESASTTIGAVDAVTTGRFALATDDDNPIYHDVDEARRQGFPGLVVPPLLLSSVREWGAGSPESELRTDGTSGSDIGLVDGARVLGGGQDLTFAADVLVGTQVEIVSTLVDAAVKKGRNGPMVIASVQRRFTDDHGTELLVCDESRILR